MPVTAGDGYCYVYGIVPANPELPRNLTGLDDQAVSLVPFGKLAAVVSRIDLDRTVGRRADLISHSRVLDAVAAAGAVIPLRFGSVLESQSEVSKQVLEPDSERFEEMLDDLAGRSQFTVHARYEESQVLAEIVAENAEIADLRSQTRDQSEDATYHARVRLGELVMQALEAKRAIDGPVLLDALLPFAAGCNVRASAGMDHLIDVAFLVEDKQRDAFEAAAEQAAAELAGRARVKLLGPTAAYDFVAAEE
jgi:Gas vesicle synthesis protein GvpL/GvpF